MVSQKAYACIKRGKNLDVQLFAELKLREEDEEWKKEKMIKWPLTFEILYSFTLSNYHLTHT